MLGADRAGVVFNKKYDRIPLTLRETFGLDRDVARHLARNYGTRALQVGLGGVNGFTGRPDLRCTW